MKWWFQPQNKNEYHQSRIDHNLESLDFNSNPSSVVGIVTDGGQGAAKRRSHPRNNL